MAAPNLTFLDDVGAALAAFPTFASVTPGPGTPFEFQVVNNPGGTGADTATDIRLRLLARASGSTDEYLATGLDALDRGYFQCRIVSGLGSISVASGPWTTLGAGRWLALPALAQDDGVVLELRTNPPTDMITAAVQILLVPEQSFSLDIGTAAELGGLSGIASELWGGESALVEVAGNVVESSPVDDEVTIPDVAWIYQGQGHRALTESRQVNDVDGSAASLASGEEYWALIYFADDPAALVAKGDKETTASGLAAKPPLPAGALPLAYVLRQFAATIPDSQIENVWRPGRFGLFDGGALTVEIGAGRGIVASRLIRHDKTRNVTLADDDESWLWLVRDGSVAVTLDDAAPEPLAQPLFSVVTASGVVSAVTDLRRYTPRRARLSMVFSGGLAAADTAFALYDGQRDAQLDPLRPVAIHLTDLNGDNTTGLIRFEVELLLAGTWTTIYTSSATEDRRPEIAAGATDIFDLDSRPEVLTIPPGTLVRSTVQALTLNGTPPAGAVVSLKIESE